MRKIMLWTVCTVTGLLAAAGCAQTRVGAAPPPEARVVLEYVPATRAEARAQARLEQTDQKTRHQVEKAEKEMEAAASAFNAAAMALDATELPPGAVRPTKEEVDRLFKIAEGKWKEYNALITAQNDRYEAFLKEYPKNWFARHRYAWFLADMHLEEEAGAEWRKVIAQEPRFPFAYNNLGTIYNHNGRDLEAIILFRKAVELYDADPTFHANLAVNYTTHRYEAMKEFEWDLPKTFHECVREFSRARELARAQGDAAAEKQYAYDVASQYVMAKFFQLEETPEQRSQTADAALKEWDYYLGLNLTDSERAIAMRNVATIYLRGKQDPATALQWLEKVAVLQPDDPTTRTLIEQARRAKGAPPSKP